MCLSYVPTYIVHTRIYSYAYKNGKDGEIHRARHRLEMKLGIHHVPCELVSAVDFAFRK